MPRRFVDLPLFWQIFLPLLVILIVGVAGALFGVQGLSASRTQLKDFHDYDIKLIIHTNHLDKDIVRLHQFLLEHLAAEDLEHMNRLRLSMDVQRNYILVNVRTFTKMQSRGHQMTSRLIADLEVKTIAYFQASDDLLTLSEDFEKEQGYDHLFTSVNPMLRELSTLSSQLVNHTDEDIGKRYLASLAQQKQYIWAIVEYGVGSIILFLVVAWFLSRTISRRMHLVSQMAGELGDGNLSRRLKLPGLDEFGVLGHDLNRMAERCETLVLELDIQHDALAEEKERAEVTLSSIGDAVIALGANGSIRYTNSAASKLCNREIAQGKPLVDILALPDTDSPEVVAGLIHDALVLGAQEQNLELTIKGHDGNHYTMELSIAPIHSRKRGIDGAVMVLRDVSEKTEMAREISWRASHDSLTKLINRHEFEVRMTHAIEELVPGDQQHIIAYLDLDQFKVVNDTCGHMAGDQLLRRVADVLQSRVRGSDTLARLGGDEFGLLLLNCSLKKAKELVEGLREAIMDIRFLWKDKVFSVGCSIGLAAIDSSSNSVYQVLSNADAACYAAKEQGRNRTHIYVEEDQVLARRRGEMDWLSEIHQALDENRFVLYAQPIIPLDKKIHSYMHFEVLMRMVDRDGSLILPGAFIAAAERFDIMRRIDRWVVHNTLRSLVSSLKKDPTSDQLDICAINLSGASLGNESFLKFLVTQISESGIRGEQLCFEITETSAIANLAEAVQFIEVMHGLGSRFALDDFGSGLSSFSYLKTLPVDYLKIDGQFVKDIEKDPVDRSMVEAINNIGKVMGIKTIAEYVETTSIATELQRIGVDYGQGWALAKPEPLDDLLGRNIKEYVEIPTDSPS